jgi:hypothetical protein
VINLAIVVVVVVIALGDAARLRRRFTGSTSV